MRLPLHTLRRQYSTRTGVEFIRILVMAMLEFALPTYEADTIRSLIKVVRAFTGKIEFHFGGEW